MRNPTLVEKMKEAARKAANPHEMDTHFSTCLCPQCETLGRVARAALAVVHDKLKMDGHFAAADALENDLAND